MSCEAGKEGRRKLICATKNQRKTSNGETSNEPSSPQVSPMVVSNSICQVKLSATTASPPDVKLPRTPLCNAIGRPQPWWRHALGAPICSIILNSLGVKTRGTVSFSAQLARTHTATW